MLIPNPSTTYLPITNFLKQCKTIKQVNQTHAKIITTTTIPPNPQTLIKILYTITTLLPSTTKPNSNYVISIFNSIQTPSTFCYNTVIRAHTILSSPYTAISWFAEMRRNDLLPDFHTFPFIFKACAQIRSVSIAETIHCEALKFGFVSDLFVLNSLVHVYSIVDRINHACKLFDESHHRDGFTYNALIDGFVKAGEINRAHKLFNVMPRHDNVSWATLISGYARMNKCKEAIELFNHMIALNFRPDNIALVSTLSACAQSGEFDQGVVIHSYIKTNRLKLDSFLTTGLVDFYAKCGFIETAIEIFESCSDKNLFTWNAMLVGLAMHGHGRLTLGYFLRMVECRVNPDGVSFLGLLVGCSHSGLVDEAKNVFDEMESVYNVTREPKHYGAMVDLLGRAGLIEEAVEMIKDMPLGGGYVSVWTGLLGGCKIHGNVEVAEIAAEYVMRLKPEDGGVYSIMASVYANAERWDDVGKIRRRSVDSNRVKRVAGCSSIRLNGVTYEFVAGDDLHCDTSEIYFLLNGMKEHQF